MTARLSATVVAAAAAAAVGLVTGHLLPGHLSSAPETTIADVCPLVRVRVYSGDDRGRCRRW